MSDSAMQTIAAELRRLRKLPGPLDEAKMTEARVLVRGFGGGDPGVALTRLIDLAQEHANRDIEAAVSSIGWGLRSETVLDRFSEYGEPRFVDGRTVRRWSDSGIYKLSLLILGKEPWLQPYIRQVLVVDNDGVNVGIDLRIPPNLRMSAIQMWVGRREIVIDMAPIAHSSKEQRIASGLEPLASLGDLPLTVRLQWIGEKYPRYVSTTRGPTDVIFTSRLSFAEMKTTVGMWPHRSTDAAVDD